MTLAAEAGRDHDKGARATRRQVAAFVAGSAVLAAIFLLFRNWTLLTGRAMPGEVPGRDFLVFWHASHLLWRGDFATLFNPAAFMASLAGIAGGEVGYRPFPYPPLAIWVVAPLAALPYGAAFVLWMFATFAGFAWTMRRFFARTWQCALVLLAAPACLINISFGQNGFLVAALLCGGLLALESRPVLAGILIGAATFKPQFGLLIPFVLLAGGYFRSFLVAGATAAVLVLVSIAIVGLEPWQAFLATGIAAQRDFLERFEGIDQAMVPSFVMAARLLGLPLALGYAVQAVAALAALVACCWAVRRPVPHADKIAVVLVGTVIATPYCFGYDLALLAAAQIMTWPAGSRAGRFVYGFVWLLPVIMIVTGLAGIPIAPLALLVFGYFLLQRVATARL